VTKKEHPLYEVWRSMIRRCHDPKFKHFKNYGARGIAVCPEWRQSFWQFVADLGERPVGYTLERKNNSLGYAPGNVKWATADEQALNKRTNRLLTVSGVTKTMQEWSDARGLPKTTLLNRIRRGWSDAEVVMTTAQPKASDHCIFPRGGFKECQKLGLNPETVKSRLRRGWSWSRAITESIRREHASRVKS
jgi:hypothetical protein